MSIARSVARSVASSVARSVAGSVGGNGSVSFSDAFNRADGTLGVNWETYSTITWGVVSNQASTTSSGGGRANYATSLTTESQFVEFDIATWGAANAIVGPIVYATDNSENGYLIAIKNDNSSTYRVYRLTGASLTQIGSAVNATAPVAPFTFRAEVSGNVLIGKMNGTQVISQDISATDYSANRKVGLYSDRTTNRVDNFSGGDL